MRSLEYEPFKKTLKFLKKSFIEISFTYHKFTHLKCTTQKCLVCSQICATITVNFRTFFHLKKETLREVVQDISREDPELTSSHTHQVYTHLLSNCS